MPPYYHEHSVYELEPEDSEETSAAMRMHLARVLLGRLLGQLAKTECMLEGVHA